MTVPSLGKVEFEVYAGYLARNLARDQFIYSQGMKGLDQPQSGLAQVTAVGIGDSSNKLALPKGHALLLTPVRLRHVHVTFFESQGLE